MAPKAALRRGLMGIDGGVGTALRLTVVWAFREG
jgi:hypothetical protein